MFSEELYKSIEEKAANLFYTISATKQTIG